MAEYLKPQSPLQHKDGNYFYPLTTIDQILNEDGSRFNTTALNIDLTNAAEGPASAINADTLNGYTAEELMQARHSANIVITLLASDGALLNNIPVKIYDSITNQLIESFTYSSPYTLNLPLGTEFRVECEQIDKYAAPTPKDYVASAANPMMLNLIYQLGKRYGYRREKAESSPSDRITYLYDAVGMAPASTDLSSNKFNPGDWGDFIEEVARPVMLTYDGEVDYELDHNDQTKKLDGSMSDITDTNYGGNAMVEFRKYKWVKRYQDDEYEYVIFSDIQWDDTYRAYAHMNAQGKVQDAFYWGMFKGSNVSSKLRSMGVNNPMGSQTAQTEINYASANGPGYYTVYKSGRDFIMDLLVLISKTDNAQSAFGNGRGGQSSVVACGSLKNQPGFWGTSANSTSDVKVFWIEGMWGNFWEKTAGCVFNKTIMVKMYPPYNVLGEGYKNTGIIPSVIASAYPNDSLNTSEFGWLPLTPCSGSATTYYCDYSYYKNTSTEIYYLMCGGQCGSDAKGIGPRAFDLELLYTATNAAWGSRISYIEP